MAPERNLIFHRHHIFARLSAPWTDQATLPALDLDTIRNWSSCPAEARPHGRRWPGRQSTSTRRAVHRHPVDTFADTNRSIYGIPNRLRRNTTQQEMRI